MDFNDKTNGITGKLDIERFDSTGVLVEKVTVPNIVVTAGKNYIASRIVGTASAVMSHMAIGTSGTAPAIGDTVLGAQVGAAVALTSSNAVGNVVTYSALFGAGVGTGAIQEAGIFNASSAGTMLAHTTFSVINKGAGDSINITWTVTCN